MSDHRYNRPVLALSLAVVVAAALAGCIRHQVDPLQVEPIQINVDVNLRVDRELDEFFDFEEELDEELPPPPPPPVEGEAGP